jgi:D-glycero-D-manno-heptose 1,7-bisphosphate phosphatase
MDRSGPELAPPSLPDHRICVDDTGVWRAVAPAGSPASLRHVPRPPALFLDRDGVIVEEVGHISRPDQVRLVTDTARLIAKANRLGIPVVMVSNQSGLGRGLFTWSDFMVVHRHLCVELLRHGAALSAAFASPSHPDAVAAYAHPDHPARKPGSGMLRCAAAVLQLDLAASWIVGDRAGDIIAGLRAGLAGGIVLHRHGGGLLRQVTREAGGGSQFQVRHASTPAAVEALLPFF